MWDTWNMHENLILLLCHSSFSLAITNLAIFPWVLSKTLTSDIIFVYPVPCCPLMCSIIPEDLNMLGTWKLKWIKSYLSHILLPLILAYILKTENIAHMQMCFSPLRFLSSRHETKGARLFAFAASLTTLHKQSQFWRKSKPKIKSVPPYPCLIKGMHM